MDAGHGCHASSDWPMTDGEYIRNTDYKEFDSKETRFLDENHGAYLIAAILKREYERDFRLEPSHVVIDNTPMTEIPFNRHTVTIGIGNQVIDYDTALNQQEQVQEVQCRIAWEIEKVKEEMEKVRIIQQAWYDDFRNNKYINDLTLADIRARSIGDACAEDKQQSEEKMESSSDSSGIMLVRNAYSVGQTPSTTLIPRSRYMIGSNQNEASGLPRVSM